MEILKELVRLANHLDTSGHRAATPATAPATNPNTQTLE